MQNEESLVARLRHHVEALYPILYLVTQDEIHADRLICRLADGRKVLEWNLAYGCVDFDTKRPLVADGEYTDLGRALENWLDQELENHFLLVKDTHFALRENPVAISRLKAIANRIRRDEATRATVFLVSDAHNIPPELEEVVTVFELPLPSEEAIREIVKGHAQGYGYELDQEVFGNLILALRGLSAYQIELLLNRGYQKDGAVLGDDVQLVNDEKEQIVKKSNVLEMVSVRESIDDIGGLAVMKDWLRRKKKVMDDLDAAREFGVEMPKGTMIVGMPGCGKSLAAKAAAALFRVPLLRLDVGALMGQYVGVSESNMRKALRLAESVSPCVLWIDEVEKAFPDVRGEGHEITKRLFGYLLTWMQEKTTPVFVVGTANDTSKLPPELLRKGRFDEVFFVDFPSEEERERILEVHLERRKQKAPMFDTRKLAAMTGDFSGAELETVVQDAIERAFVDGKTKLTDEFLMGAAEDVTPLSQRDAAKVKEDKARFKRGEIRNASGAGN